MNRRQLGFTLVELMTVVVIVAILASIAIPSYRQYMRRADRAEAKTALLENVQFLERVRTASNRYDKDAAGNDITVNSLPVQQSPRDGVARYTITLDEEALDRATYSLRAVPVRNGPMDDDACGTFMVNEQGKKELEDATAAVSDCWNR